METRVRAGLGVVSEWRTFWSAPVGELRKFGVIIGGMVALIFSGIIPWLTSASQWPIWPLLIGGPLVGLGLIAPRVLRPLYVFWMMIGIMLGLIVSPIILGILFYLVVTPFGLVRRTFGRDSVEKAFDASAPTYRVDVSSMDQDMRRPY